MDKDEKIKEMEEHISNLETELQFMIRNINHEKTQLKNTTFLLHYLATQLHTSLSNNTQEQFIQHFLRFINKTTTNITKDKAVLFKSRSNY